MRSDIQRELDLAASDHCGGNVLAALRLVVYTEVSSVGSFVGTISIGAAFHAADVRS